MIAGELLYSIIRRRGQDDRGTVYRKTGSKNHTNDRVYEENWTKNCTSIEASSPTRHQATDTLNTQPNPEPLLRRPPLGGEPQPRAAWTSCSPN
jgi:hypothetical protein